MLSCNLMVFICAFRFIFEKCVCLVVALNFMTLWHHEMPFVCEMFVFFLVGMCCWYAVWACMCVRVCARVCTCERELLLYFPCESLLYFSRELLLYSCVSLFSYEFVVFFLCKLLLLSLFCRLPICGELELAFIWFSVRIYGQTINTNGYYAQIWAVSTICCKQIDCEFLHTFGTVMG